MSPPLPLHPCHGQAFLSQIWRAVKVGLSTRGQERAFECAHGVPACVGERAQVIRIQPNEAIYLKINNKVPGLGLRIDISRLDLSYKSKYNTTLPGAGCGGGHWAAAVALPGGAGGRWEALRGRSCWNSRALVWPRAAGSGRPAGSLRFLPISTLRSAGGLSMRRSEARALIWLVQTPTSG